MIRIVRRAALCLVLTVLGLGTARAQGRKPPLSNADIDDIARLEMLEDRRQFDADELRRLLAAAHPEVRRRAAVTVARLAKKEGVGLLLARPLETDTAIAATVVFAVGQLRDTMTVRWFDSLLKHPRTSPSVAAEAAIALGKLKTSAAREALANYLLTVVPSRENSVVIGEALFSIGRTTPRGDLAPILKWTTSRDEELRWRATWALYRPHDPASIKTLLTLSKDASPTVRSWAVRSLTKPQADSAMLGSAAEAMLLVAARDADRGVQTEALRALGTYSDPSAISALLLGLQSRDSWLSVTAAEGLGRIKDPSTIPQLVTATAVTRPCALRTTARLSLGMFAPMEALAAMVDIARDTVPYCRVSSIQALRRAQNLPATGTPLRTTIDALLADSSLAPPAPGRAGGGGVPRNVEETRPARGLEDYRAIVERWIVPEYNGAPRPIARWETPRGAIDLELYPGDAPLAVDDFVHRIESGAIIGTQFTRVVADFVDQQETIRGGTRLRDEVNRLGLTRGNLAWATAGLDTGNPGYTLGHTPQPHNEGDFTSLGRVIRGMEAVDRIELGDRIIAARMLRKN